MAPQVPDFTTSDAGTAPQGKPYILEAQVGFLLRQVSQRHGTIFASKIGDDVTPTQWATITKLAEKGPCSQNLLGRLTAMDVATIKGVVDRLCKRGLTMTRSDPNDGRRLIVMLTQEGQRLAQALVPNAEAITEETLQPLTANERDQLMHLLCKMI